MPFPSDTLYPSDSLYPSGLDVGQTTTPIPEWRMVLAEAYGTANIGEIDNALDRVFSFKLNQPGTASFKIPLSSAMAQEILTRGEALIKLYKGDALQMNLEITTAELVGQGGVSMLGIVATEAMWPRLQHTLVGKSTTGLSQTTLTPKTTFIGTQLFTTWNDTGIIGYDGVGAVTFTGGPWRYKPLMELITELAYTFSGFDFHMIPVEPTDYGLNVCTIGWLWMDDTLGAARPQAVFEYGPDTRANLESYKYVIDTGNMVNAAYVPPSDFPDNAGLAVATSEDASSIATRGRREEFISSDLVDATLRDELADEHVAVRKQPRELFLITPGVETANTPTFGRRAGNPISGFDPDISYDYFVGDSVTARVNEADLVVLNASVRVYGADISLTNEGLASTQLTVVQE